MAESLGPVSVLAAAVIGRHYLTSAGRGVDIASALGIQPLPKVARLLDTAMMMGMVRIEVVGDRLVDME